MKFLFVIKILYKHRFIFIKEIKILIVTKNVSSKVSSKTNLFIKHQSLNNNEHLNEMSSKL